MDYKPPHPLDVVITPDILAKYQRVFAFLLRLMRVKQAMQAVSRMTRKDTQRLFPTFTQANRQLLHFRFVAQAFITAVEQYTFDTCIGGNFDAFLSRLVPADSHSQSTSEARNTPIGLPSVFALADAHNDTLDAILSALLLRSSQRAGGDLLRGALEIVLEFANMVESRRSGAQEEYAAKDELQNLYVRFAGKVGALTKVLKGYVDKNLGTSNGYLHADGALLVNTRPLRGAHSLNDLLIRLDLGTWWIDQIPRRSASRGAS
ncbi:hypothetical protein HGRIS_013656 [Hohenbuehelia grisea]|uniref:Spindle pole body component n=1 Tax=Hohenbuehelia grisea TaxID=104357 RepID=A0ABR3IWD6_9AGAR